MYLTCAEARELDRRAIEEIGIPGMVLMENAGRGMAALLVSLGVQGPVVVCCGKGNNGGDGYVIARYLDAWGIAVKVLLFSDPRELTGDAADHYQILSHCRIPITVLIPLDRAVLRRELADAAWVVDALFGSGLKGPVRPPYDAVIDEINACSARVLAADIPSGLDSDTGRPLGPTVRAHVTATIVAPKRGFAEAGASEWLGNVHVIDIGLPRVLWPGARPSGGDRT